MGKSGNTLRRWGRVLVHTLDLYEITKKWVAAIAGNGEIDVWCQENFEKGLKVFFGFNKKKTPKPELDCPFIIVYPEKKREGIGLETYPYDIFIGMTILVGDESEIIDGNVVEIRGSKEICELWQLIYGTVMGVNTNFPISEAEFAMDPVSMFPIVVAEGSCRLEVRPAVGRELVY